MILFQRELIHVANRYHVKSGGWSCNDIDDVMMIGTVKTVKTQISNINTGQSSLLSRPLPEFSEVVGKSRGFGRMFVSMQTEIYSVKMFSLR